MMLGSFKHGIDTKNRLFIPSKFREELGESFVIARSPRGKCLRVFPAEEWNATLKKYDSLDARDREVIVRALTRNAAQVSPDTQGRVVLPPELIEHAKIEKNIMIVGCCDYAEIWSDAIYRDMKAEEDVEALLEELEDLGL
jgi:MraZ protein